jgi:hypothetical protein
MMTINIVRLSWTRRMKLCPGLEKKGGIEVPDIHALTTEPIIGSTSEQAPTLPIELRTRGTTDG